MSDRALLVELLEFIDSITIVNHYNNLQRKASEIRTRMVASVQSCESCKKGQSIIWCSLQGSEGQINYDNCKWEKKDEKHLDVNDHYDWHYGKKDGN